MKNHRNARKEFNSMVAAYATIDRDYIWIDLTYFEEQQKKAKFNRLLSIIKWTTKHIPAFKIILAGVPWNVENVSFQYAANDLGKVLDHMCQNSGASYLIKVYDARNCTVRFVATKTLDPNEIRSTIITNFGLEEYGIEPGRCTSRKKYWQ